MKETIPISMPTAVRLNGEMLHGWVVFESVELNKEINRSDAQKRKKNPQLPSELRAVFHVDLTVSLSVSENTEKFLWASEIVSSSGALNKSEKISRAAHWKYSLIPLTVRIVDFNRSIFPSRDLPHLLHQLVAHRQNHPAPHYYEPIFFEDDVTLRRRQCLLMSRNVSNPHPKLQLHLVATSPLYFFFKKMQQQILLKISEFLGEDEVDQIKLSLSDEYIYRHVLSQVISWIHIYLQYHAFRQDLNFYVGRKSFAGVSSSALIMSIWRAAVLFLYLYDAGTSYLVLFSFAKDFWYSVWKLMRFWKWTLTDIRNHVVGRVQRTLSLGASLSGVTSSSLLVLPNTGSNKDVSLVTMTNHSDDISKVQPETKTFANDNEAEISRVRERERERESEEYDHIAVVHVSLVVLPMAIGVTLFSLFHFTYRSWWSWLISSLADAVYYFGFISMTPQLYINYRLRSVAHLPLQAFMFKLFSTFIDDVFAFLVEMPLKHRLMTLRDDVIFLGFLYQW